MSENFREGYFSWLCRLALSSPGLGSSETVWTLCNQLHATPFYWRVRNDENRNEDGRDLRVLFLDTFKFDESDNPWLDEPASVFEVLIALARRAAYESYGSPDQWFQLFLRNLELDRFSDFVYNDHIEHEVEHTIQTWLSRNYGRDGTGGLFPLRYDKRDQRRVEIWYQLAAYLLEGNHP